MKEQSNIEFIARWNGGSHFYGLETPESDLDLRGIFVATEARHILGLDHIGKEQLIEIRDEDPAKKKDVVYREIRHWMAQLHKGTSESIEILWAEDSAFDFTSPSFRAIRALRSRLLDSDEFFRRLRGYMQGEMRLALGERKGQIGGKRYKAFLKYGFSPKNFVHLFRLAVMGIHFFKTGEIVVKIRDVNEKVFNFVYWLKTEPQEFSAELLQGEVKKYEALLEEAYKNTKISTKFDYELANGILKNVYKAHL